MSVGKFRIKAHGAGDTRYIMIDPGIAFGDFETKIRNKFGFQSKVKIKMEDEGDMITMGDQEDLDLLMESARDVANREGCEMMKMEVCRSLFSLFFLILLLTRFLSRYGLKNVLDLDTPFNPCDFGNGVMVDTNERFGLDISTPVL